MEVITVSAICFERDGRVLTVRKRGTSAYMLPGGKPEGGESAAECAVREVHEELGLTLEPTSLEHLGTWDAQAANEVGATVRATVFRSGAAIEPRIQAEIDDARWIDPAEGVDDPLEAPLNRVFVFPLLLAR